MGKRRLRPCQRDGTTTHCRQRLADGLDHDINLVIAKALFGQLAANVAPTEIVRQVALFGAQNGMAGA